jgi:serine/threonine protein kinase
MSVVYKANQLRVNRHVAVKTLRMQLDSKPIYRERFQNEINLLCALSHPNIVTVYDCVIGPDDQPYVIMDYLRGRSLEVLIGQEGPLPVDRFLRIAVQVCGALDHAHRKGVIHRDLKPGNIVLMDDESDFVKVVDFGLAKLNDTNRRLTQSGELWGSPPYMSPEHCQSKPEDERSDLYSFGAVMYEMLTGKDPFHYATSVYELIQIHINTDPPPLAEANPLVHVPAELEAVIFKSMAKKPEDRYQTAADLRDALVAVSSSLGTRNSGDLLALPTAGKNRSNSTGEIIPAPGAENFLPAGSAKSTTPSEHFRRALDPMRGINVDELFDGTASGARTADYAAAGESKASPAKEPTLPKEAASESVNNIKKLRNQNQKPLITPLRIVALAGLCLVALLINALPHFMNKPAKISPSGAPQASATNSSGPTTSSAPSTTNSAGSTTNSAGSTTNSAGAATSSTGSAASTKPNQPATATHSTPTAHSTAAHQSAPTHQATAAAAHQTAATHQPAPTHQISVTHTPAAHQAKTHPSSSAGKSSNPWDALQGLRKGK